MIISAWIDLAAPRLAIGEKGRVEAALGALADAKTDGLKHEPLRCVAGAEPQCLSIRFKRRHDYIKNRVKDLSGLLVSNTWSNRNRFPFKYANETALLHK